MSRERRVSGHSVVDVRPAALREIGPHPEDSKPVTVHEGRYGAYVKHGKTNATLPKDSDPMTISLEDAVALLTARAAKGGKAPAKKANGKSKKAAATNATAAENGAAKPAAKKKAPAKKKSAAKTAGTKSKTKKAAAAVPSAN